MSSPSTTRYGCDSLSNRVSVRVSQSGCRSVGGSDAPSNDDYVNTPVSPQRPSYGYVPEDPLERPHVTIVTPFFNTGAVFRETARSVLQQSFQQWEWLIVDDASTDEESLAALEELRQSDGRVQVLRHTANRGLSAARNTGFSSAQADLVVPLDSDDLLEPTAIEKWYWFLQSHSEFAFCKGFVAVFGTEEYLWRRGFHNGTAFLIKNQTDSTSMIRRSVHQAVGGYDETNRDGLEDWDFWLRCANADYWGGTIPDCLNWVRRRGGRRGRWSNWDEGPNQRAFRTGLRERYPKLWKGDFPTIPYKVHVPNEPVSDSIACANRLRKDRPRMLLLVSSLDSAKGDKDSLDLLRQFTSGGWETTVVATAPSQHPGLYRFERLTEDIFLPHRFLRPSDYPRFLRYLIGSRQIDLVLVAHSEFGYMILPYLRAHFPDVTFLDYCLGGEQSQGDGGYSRLAVNYRESFDLGIVSSEHLKGWMIDHGADPERIEVCRLESVVQLAERGARLRATSSRFPTSAASGRHSAARAVESVAVMQGHRPLMEQTINAGWRMLTYRALNAAFDPFYNWGVRHGWRWQSQLANRVVGLLLRSGWAGSRGPAQTLGRDEAGIAPAESPTTPPIPSIFVEAAAKRDPKLPPWPEWISRERSYWEDCLRRAVGGPRVLIANNVPGFYHTTNMETLLAAALTVRGADVHVLLCDRVLTACLKNKFSSCSPDQLIGEGFRKRVCGGCNRNGGSFAQLGIAVHGYEELLSTEERKELRDLALSVPAEEVSSFRYHDLAVGEHAYAGALRYYSTGDLEGQERAGEVLARYLESGLLTAHTMEKLLRRHGFEAACFHHGIYIPQGVVGEVCRNRNVRVTTWNIAYRKGCFLFSHGDSYHHTLLDEPTSVWKDMRYTDEQDQTIKEYLRSRWSGSQDWIYFHDTPDDSMDTLIRETGIDLNKPIIGMLTNVMWDAQVHYRDNAFPSMLDWIVETIRHFAKRPDIQLLIRVHPAELRGLQASRQFVVDEVKRAFPDLPGNIFLIPPESNVNTYTAMQKANCAIVFGTKTGVELTSMGIPVIVAGEAWIRNKGLTIDVASKQEYFQILDGLPLEQSRLSEEDQRAARMYAYHFFMRRMLPVRSVVPTEDEFHYEVKIPSLKALEPGNDEGLDIICDGILEGTPYIYKAEERITSTRSARPAP